MISCTSVCWKHVYLIDGAHHASIYLGIVWSDNYNRNQGTTIRKKDQHKLRPCEARHSENDAWTHNIFKKDSFRCILQARASLYAGYMSK